MEELTKEEQRLLAQVESAGKWDYPLSYISTLVPTFIIIGFGIYFASNEMIVTGVTLLAGLSLHSCIHQMKTAPVWKSLIRKLKQQYDNVQKP